MLHHHHPDDGDSAHLCNSGLFLPESIVQHSRRQSVLIFFAVGLRHFKCISCLRTSLNFKGLGRKWLWSAGVPEKDDKSCQYIPCHNWNSNVSCEYKSEFLSLESACLFALLSIKDFISSYVFVWSASSFLCDVNNYFISVAPLTIKGQKVVFRVAFPFVGNSDICICLPWSNAVSTKLLQTYLLSGLSHFSSFHFPVIHVTVSVNTPTKNSKNRNKSL
jgi:hypothetical protein